MFYFVIFLFLISLYYFFVFYIVNHYGYLNEYTYNLGKKFLESKFINILGYSTFFSTIFTIDNLEK